jgi:hypothetical protein
MASRTLGTDPERNRRGHGGVVVLLALSLSILGAALLVWWSQQPRTPLLGAGQGIDAPPSSDRQWAVAHLPESEFLNTGADAHYVGSEQCLECHQDDYHAYRETGMGRSLDLLDPANEPSDIEFDHDKSGRRYKVYRRDGQMHHQEMLLPENSDESPLVMADHAIQYVIGSGRHSRSYLLEIDGFLVESPLTWYASRKAWGMSPGYDEPVHPSFSRAVDTGCLRCHSGSSTALDGSFHRIQVHETWISCERCHGPGSLHVDRWSSAEGLAAAATAGKMDHTIVNPIHLDRELSESICAQCHLRAAAGVMARGRSMDDFRPGLPLDRFRTDFRLAEERSQMTVVGHVEQLRMSRCHQQSELTCTTCHNPHGRPRETERVSYHRAQCLTCHNQDTCTVDPSVRLAKSAEDNCMTCHMPTSDTDIPHLAFTHHRIGIHPPRPEDQTVTHQERGLIPLSDQSAFSELDRRRSLGLAYVYAADDEAEQGKARDHAMRAYEILREVWSAGLRDVEVAAALALLAGRSGHDAGEYVQFALSQPDAPPMARINTLLASAAWHAERGELAKALASARKLVELRRVSGDWRLLSFLAGHGGQHAEAKAAWDYADVIDGRRPADPLTGRPR